VLGYGGSVILPGGLNRLEDGLVQRLNNLDEDEPEDFEPRPIVFNIPTPISTTVDPDSNPSSPSSEAIVVLHVDTTTSVI